MSCQLYSHRPRNPATFEPKTEGRYGRNMLIRLGYDIQFKIPQPTSMIAMLHVYPTRSMDLREPDTLHVDPAAAIEEHIDDFGNICSRFEAPVGDLRLWSSTLIEDSGEPDARDETAPLNEVQNLPPDTLRYLLASRYCEVDCLSDMATKLFGHLAPGWPTVQAICDWVHRRTTFGYNFARITKTAMDVYNERRGVCRDFQHLAITLCRSMKIPARYATGYLGDIGVPVSDSPMDFSAWFEVYLGDRWWAFDARHNAPRIGRVLMAVGRDAADVAITTSFGSAILTRFTVVTDEVTGVLAADGGSRA
jgi:transglutaminase-like putative cysteine protease